MTEGVTLSDEQGMICYTNPAEDAMFGYEPGELSGQHVTILNTYGHVFETSGDRVRDALDQMIAAVGPTGQASVTPLR